MTRRSFFTTLAAVVIAPKVLRGPRVGKWFGNFGSHMAATLHGTHAIIPPHQAHLFALDIGNKVVLDGAELQRWLKHHRNLDAGASWKFDFRRSLNG